MTAPDNTAAINENIGPKNIGQTNLSGEEFRDDERRRLGLPREVLRRLNQIDNNRAWTSVIETLAVIVLCIFVSLIWWTPWVVIPAVLLIATRQQACFVLAHDAAHYRLFRQRWLNDLVGRFVSMIVGISMCTYRVVHRLHHNHLYGHQDPDTPLHGGYPRGRGYLLRKLAKDLAGLTAHKTYAYFFGAPAINDQMDASNRPLNDTSPALRRAARQDRWLVAGFHILALGLALVLDAWVQYLVLWILPLVTVLQAILRFRAICEHGAVRDLSSPTTAARSNLGPPVWRWLIFPHQVNYHIEHHLYPAIPHYNLPDCHREMRALGLLDGAEVRDIRETIALIFAERKAAPKAVTA